MATVSNRLSSSASMIFSCSQTGHQLMPSKFFTVISKFLPAMFLVCKFHQYKRQQQELSRKKITEKELSHLNHKIDKLLNKLEEHDSELASSHDEECVICISAKATIQTFPCGHRVVCRKCFVKTIQAAVSQRLLPLRCVVCRAKILRLRQTAQGITESVNVNGKGYMATGDRSSNASSQIASNSVIGKSPFYVSPEASPASPVNEVFKNEKTFWAQTRGPLDLETKKPESSLSQPFVFERPNSASFYFLKEIPDLKRPHSEPSSPDRIISSFISDSCREASSDLCHSASTPTLSSPASSTMFNSSNFLLISNDFDSNLWKSNLSGRRRHRTNRKRCTVSPKIRPNSLLLPIDEMDEWETNYESTRDMPVLDCALSKSNPLELHDLGQEKPRLTLCQSSKLTQLNEVAPGSTELVDANLRAKSDLLRESGSLQKSERISSIISDANRNSSNLTSRKLDELPTSSASRMSTTFHKAKNFIHRLKWGFL